MNALLRLVSFTHFWAARVGSIAAPKMVMLAVSWHMYDLTGSAWDLGLVGLFQFVPAFATTFVAGHCADRMHRGRLVVLCLAAQAAVATLLAVSTAMHAVSRSGVRVCFRFHCCCWPLQAVPTWSASSYGRHAYETPDRRRGHVAAVNGLFFGAINAFGEFESGVAATAFGVVGSVVFGGCATILVSIARSELFKPLAQRETLQRTSRSVPRTTRRKARRVCLSVNSFRRVRAEMVEANQAWLNGERSTVQGQRAYVGGVTSRCTGPVVMFPNGMKTA